MDPNTITRTLYDAITPVAVTSSTDAPSIVVTSTAHGIVTGQRVLIYGHTTNVAANGIFKATAVTANAFTLTDEITGASVAGSGAGAGSGGICLPAPEVVYIKAFRNAILQVGTSGTATTTLGVVGSLGRTGSTATAPRLGLPNVGATVAPSNPYSFLQVIDLATGAAINGSTGIVVAGTDINKQFEVNINLQEYLTVIPVTWTQGAITIKLILGNGGF